MERNNHCTIEVLHASLLKIINLYLLNPNSVKAVAAVRILNALANHPERRRFSNDCDPYREALEIWSKLTSKESMPQGNIGLIEKEKLTLH